MTPMQVPEAAEGMSGTLRAGVSRLPACPAFMVLLADLPDLTASDLQQVLTAHQNTPDALIWRGATADLRPGHPIIFDASLRPDFAQLSGDGGGESLVNPLKDRTVLVPLTGDRARLDLDTPQDWADWRARSR